MEENKNQTGRVYISNQAIATIAYQSALESYGVVGMADKDIVRGISKLLFKQANNKQLFSVSSVIEFISDPFFLIRTVSPEMPKQRFIKEVP